MEWRTLVYNYQKCSWKAVLLGLTSRILVYKLLQLRLKQLHRLLADTGYFFVLLTALVMVGVLFRAVANLVALPSLTAIPFTLFAITGIHFSRRDHAFLEEISRSGFNSKVYISLEYCLLVQGVVGYQIYRGEWLVGLSLFLVAIVVGLLFPSQRLSGLKSRFMELKFLPVTAFELKIPCERQLIPLGVLWLISFLGFYHPAFLLVALLLFLFLIIDSYTFNEPLEMIPASRNFLLEKCGLHVGLFTLMFGMQFIVSWFFHRADLLILIAGYTYMVVFIVLAICMKYAKYNPLRRTNTNATVLVTTMILSLLPGLLLGALIMLVYFYFSAQKNLSHYVS